MAINDNRIINIEGVSLLVDDSNYDYFWKTRFISENSESHIIACRRILGLGPNDDALDYHRIQNMIRGDLKDIELDIIHLADSDIVKYKEPDYFKSESRDRARMAQMEKEINPSDPEFEPELEL